MFVVDATDGRVTELGVEATRGLAWSPDGTKIALVRTEGQYTGRLLVIGADGGGETELTGQGLPVGSVAWSPDGTRIAFERHGDAGPEEPNGEGLYVINADGSGLRRFTSGNPGGAGCCIHFNRDGPLAWSPDATRVAWPGPDGSILLANADGSGERRLQTGASNFVYDLAWSPDGSRLVYATRRSEDDWRDGEVATTYEWSSIYVIDADGSDRRWVATGEYPDWSR